MIPKEQHMNPIRLSILALATFAAALGPTPVMKGSETRVVRGAIDEQELRVGALVADSFVHFGVTDVATFAIP